MLTVNYFTNKNQHSKHLGCFWVFSADKMNFCNKLILRDN